MSLFGFLKREDLTEIYNQNPILLDVRTSGEFNSGSVKGAVNIPLDELSSQINKIRSWKRPVIAFCRSGMRSDQAKSILSDASIECYNGGSWKDVAKKTGG